MLSEGLIYSMSFQSEILEYFTHLNFLLSLLLKIKENFVRHTQAAQQNNQLSIKIPRAVCGAADHIKREVV